MKRIQIKTQEVGASELKALISDITPIDAVLPEKNDDDVSWNRLMEIRAKIGRVKQNKKNSIDILSEMRR